MLYYMYIDESGDLGKQSKYLIIAALIIKNPAFLDRIIKNLRRNKFKKELKKAQEIKANKSSKELIKTMLLKLNNLPDTKIFIIVLEKNKLKSDYLLNHKHKLYNFVAGKLARNIVLDKMDLEIRIDKSMGKQLLRQDFNNYFLKLLTEKSSIRKISIHHSYSHSWSGIQFADIISWSVFQKFEHNNSEFIDLLKIPIEINMTWN